MKKALLWSVLLACLFVAGCGDDDDDNDAAGDDDDDNDDNDDNNDNDDNDDNNDNNDNDDNDDFVPPSPVFGYYDEYHDGAWDWVIAQLPVYAQYGLTLFLGMQDTSLGDPELLALLREAQTQGVEVRAWILLPTEIGYWPGETNAEAFAELALDFADWFLAENLPIEWIVVDMELDINTTYAIRQMVANGDYLNAVLTMITHYQPERYEKATQIYRQLVDDLAALGFRTMVVTYPQVLDDLEDDDTFIQDVLDTPVSGIPWDEVSTMVYTTTFEELTGMTFGPYVVYDYAASTVEHFGQAASIALGVSEFLDDPGVLSAQVAAAKAAGVERIQVYSYSGSAGHADPDLWHGGFAVAPVQPQPDAPTKILRGVLRLLDRLF